jgi:hypothetical protein
MQSRNPGLIALCNRPRRESRTDATRCARHEMCLGDRVMMDIVFIVVTIGFFVAAIAYVNACERL